MECAGGDGVETTAITASGADARVTQSQQRERDMREDLKICCACKARSKVRVSHGQTPSIALP